MTLHAQVVNQKEYVLLVYIQDPLDKELPHVLANQAILKIKIITVQPVIKDAQFAKIILTDVVNVYLIQTETKLPLIVLVKMVICMILLLKNVLKVFVLKNV